MITQLAHFRSYKHLASGDVGDCKYTTKLEKFELLLVLQWQIFFGGPWGSLEICSYAALYWTV
jgi:hypothetical protein